MSDTHRHHPPTSPHLEASSSSPFYDNDAEHLDSAGDIPLGTLADTVQPELYGSAGSQGSGNLSLTRDIRGPNVVDFEELEQARGAQSPGRMVQIEEPVSLGDRLLRRVSAKRRGTNKKKSGDTDHATSGRLGRHKSLVRPERSRLADDPNSPYYYTANRAAALQAARQKGKKDTGGGNVIRRRKTAVVHPSATQKSERFKLPGCWMMFTWAVTCCIPACLLRKLGRETKPMQLAYREKLALVLIIFIMCLAVGFLTFGLQQILCGPLTSVRVKGGFIDNSHAVIHGKLYDLKDYKHPLASGITDPNLLSNSTNAGGKDLSFRFQHINSNCKDVLVPQPGTGDANGGVYNYFPCVDLDAWSSPNPGLNPGRVGCHLSPNARRQLSARSNGLKFLGDVYYDWVDLDTNTEWNYIVYDGAVLNVDLMLWVLPTIDVSPEIQWFIDNTNQFRGRDASLKLSSTPQFKAAGRCMMDLIKVGYVEAETLGCIINNVILTASLIVIVSVVLIKFFLAVIFGWMLSRKLGALKKETSEERKKRQEEIEAWTQDINVNPQGVQITSNMLRPGSSRGFLPNTSRFSTIQPGDEPGRQFYPEFAFPGALGQNGSRQSSLYRGKPGNWSIPPSPLMKTTPTMQSQSLPLELANLPSSKQLTNLISNTTRVNQALSEVVSPYDFPLAHTFLLVTCYSEGELGLRTTLDSLAITDYPATHKTLLVIADGIITGAGNELSTPDICLSMMQDFLIPPAQVKGHSYVAIADGERRHNLAKVYAGYYRYDSATVPVERQQKVPMILIVKVGTEAEKNNAKPGNRGKRDSQIILMGFLQRVMFDERMQSLDAEFFNAVWNLTGVPPDLFEIVLMVDADTKVYPDSLSRMVAVMARDTEVMGLCGETKIANKSQSWVTMIQVFEYYISHHMNKAFESIFGGVTCLPGCFCMYRIKAPKGRNGFWVPILANPDIVEHYAENVVDTLHKKNLLLLGEDRYLTTLMLKTFPKRKMLFVPQAVCKTIVPDTFAVLLSQRRRWINSTVHNLLELVLVRDLCGTFCFSMQFVIFMELVGTVVLPAAITFTLYLIVISFFTDPVPIIPLLLLAAILGLPAVLILLTSRRVSYVGWMLIYLLSLPIWNFVLPAYAFWHFDDFSWGETRRVSGQGKETSHGDKEGEFDSSHIVMRRWCEFERERRKHLAANLQGELTSGKLSDDHVDIGYPAPSTVAAVLGEYDDTKSSGQVSANSSGQLGMLSQLPPAVVTQDSDPSMSMFPSSEGPSRAPGSHGVYKRSQLGM